MTKLKMPIFREFVKYDFTNRLIDAEMDYDDGKITKEEFYKIIRLYKEDTEFIYLVELFNLLEVK